MSKPYTCDVTYFKRIGRVMIYSSRSKDWNECHISPVCVPTREDKNKYVFTRDQVKEIDKLLMFMRNAHSMGVLEENMRVRKALKLI